MATNEGSLRRYAHTAYEAAIEADNNYQSELDRLGVERYTQAAKGVEGSELRRLYDAKLEADTERSRATDALRRC